MTWNKKLFNYKVIDWIDYYNFGLDQDCFNFKISISMNLNNIFRLQIVSNKKLLNYEVVDHV